MLVQESTADTVLCSTTAPNAVYVAFVRGNGFGTCRFCLHIPFSLSYFRSALICIGQRQDRLLCLSGLVFLLGHCLVVTQVAHSVLVSSTALPLSTSSSGSITPVNNHFLDCFVSAYNTPSSLLTHHLNPF